MARKHSRIKLTDKSLQELKDKGFLYVLIKGYTPAQRNDRIELNQFILVPVRALPDAPGEKEIFAPIDSEVLTFWANPSEDGIEAYIELSLESA
ncbi:MAG TPA: hypothetical protein VGQ51_15290 [Puia sp.]|jgi:hypothetical protein|nr:hypothetical protein [Puia sp.]